MVDFVGVKSGVESILCKGYAIKKKKKKSWLESMVLDFRTS